MENDMDAEAHDAAHEEAEEESEASGSASSAAATPPMIQPAPPPKGCAHTPRNKAGRNICTKCGADVPE